MSWSERDEVMIMTMMMMMMMMMGVHDVPEVRHEFGREKIQTSLLLVLLILPVLKLCMMASLRINFKCTIT
jgi:hypothetical protein